MAGADTSARQLQQFGQVVNSTQANLNKIGTGAGHVAGGIAKLGIALGVAAATGLGFAAKKAIDFEDAFAGVRKTVEGTGPELDKLNKELRTLATRIPVNFVDLAQIAQEAGALGVASGDVEKFTDVVSRLSAATVGLTTEAAAEAFGKLGNVLHLHGPDYERLGSALIELGNNAASSEGDIIEVAKRFAAAGNQAGLSAAQILGFSSAIASLGVEPEAAGSALSRVFNKISTFIGTGDAKMKAFAKVSKMTVKEFSDLYAHDAAGALTVFLQGLSKLDKFQGAKALKDAGLTNTRDRNVLLLLAQNTGELTRQVDLSSNAFVKNTALMDVSNRRFDTFKNHLITLKNTLFEGAAAMAEGFTPALARLAEKVRTFVTAHMGDLVQFGKDLGAQIDKIDWNRVADAAQNVADVARTILDLVSKIPPELSLAVAGFIGLNKVTGGALGEIAGGALDIAKGAAGLALRAAGGRIGGKVGGAIGALTATPVFVVNMPLGGFGGGIPPIAGAAETGGGLLTKGLKLLPWVAFGALIAEGFVQGNKDHPEFYGSHPDTTGGRSGTGNRSYSGVPTTRANMLPSSERGESNAAAAAAAATAAVAARDSALLGSKTTLTPEALSALAGVIHQAGDTSNAPTADKAIKDAIDAEKKALTAKLAEIHETFTTNLRGLRRSTEANDVAKFARALAAQAEKGVGGVKGTQAVLSELEKKLRGTTDAGARSALVAAIHKVEAKLPNREFVAQQLHKADRIIHSNESTKAKVADLLAVQRTLKDRGDTHAAAIVGRKIDALKTKNTFDTRAEGAGIRASIEAKKWQFTTNITNYVSAVTHVSNLETIKSTTTAKTRGNVFVS